MWNEHDKAGVSSGRRDISPRPSKDPSNRPSPRDPVPFYTLKIAKPFELEFGGVLPQLEIRYETWGRLNPARDNAILVCPAFSAGSHARSHRGNTREGWWEKIIGPGLALDTERYCVLCPSLLGGSEGTTGPNSIRPGTNAPFGKHFPTISVMDIVNAHIRLLDALHIERLYAVVGGSLGAMEALELGIRHKGRTSRVLAISGTDQTRPYTAAIRHLGREAIRLAESFGDEQEGLKLARRFATLFYRSQDDFNRRFSTPIHSDLLPDQALTPFADIESYLAHQGHKALHLFNKDSYLTLSLAMDLHNVWRGYSCQEEALEGLDSCFMIAGVREDSLISLAEQKQFHQALIDLGKHSHWRCLSSSVGHDAFLVEVDLVKDLIEDLLNLSP